MLPAEITTEAVRCASDEADFDGEALSERLTCDLHELDDLMDDYIAVVVEKLAEEHGLTEEQAEELRDRICWRLELLPAEK